MHDSAFHGLHNFDIPRHLSWKRKTTTMSANYSELPEYLVPRSLSIHRKFKVRSFKSHKYSKEMFHFNKINKISVSALHNLPSIFHKIRTIFLTKERTSVATPAMFKWNHSRISNSRTFIIYYYVYTGYWIFSLIWYET